MADFSLLQTPNFMQSALTGFQAGRQIGQQNRLNTALQGVDLTRPETIMPVLQADPGTGASLLSASSTLATARRDAATRAATAKGIKAVIGMSDSSDAPTPAAPALAPQAIPHITDAAGAGAATGALAATAPVAPGMTPSPLPANPGDPQSDIVVTGPHQAAPVAPAAPVPAHTQAEADWIDADPKGYIEAQRSISTMKKAQREQLDSAMNTFGAAVEQAKAMPYEQRHAYIATQRAQLIAHGVDPQQIDNFDPTDGNIQGIEGQVLGVKGLLERQDKDRTFGLEQARLSETQHHDRVDEGQGQQRIGLEGASVGIAGGHLALDRQREGREAAAAAAKAPAGLMSIPAPSTRAAYAALPKGTTYRAPDGSMRVK